MSRLISRGVLLLSAIFAGALYGGAPLGDPNQPYDRLPGTLETSHVKWATPLPQGPLKVLVLIPYKNAREVVELRQRLALEYTVIMNVSKSSWWLGYCEGGDASPLGDGEKTLNRLAGERLALDRHYDAIIIGKVSWEIIPAAFKTLILEHVRQGAGLVYVSPNRSTGGNPPEAAAEDPQYQALFQQSLEPYLTSRLTTCLPFDLIPLVPVPTGKAYLPYELSGALPAPPRAPQDKIAGFMPGQQMVSLRSVPEGKGRIVVIDYFDKGGSASSDNSLTPEIYYDPVGYDYAFALLARCVLFAANRDSGVRAEILFPQAPDTLAIPLEDKPLPRQWPVKIPAVVFDRDETPAVRLLFQAESAPVGTSLDFQLRDSAGAVLQSGRQPVASLPARHELTLPTLSRGNYLADLRVLDGKDNVLTFVSRSFRVETPCQVTQVKTERDRYAEGDTIKGSTRFFLPLPADCTAEAQAVDTWNRIVARIPVTLVANRRSGTFELPVLRPLCRLWDIVVVIRDSRGEVGRAKTWVGIPDWNFDEYLMPLIFCSMPTGGSWKGYLYTEQVRKYGVNSTNASLIYGSIEQYEDFERAHLASISFAEHMGQLGHARALGEKTDQEFTVSCMTERSLMARAVADTGKPLDPAKFPYTFNQWQHDANYINRRLQEYQETLKFGSPYYALSGEEYQSGEFWGEENSCFCPLCTKRFQDWCRGIYKDDLAALNQEWGSAFKSWDEIRGILMRPAADTDQLPRWVAFRHFMRSYVWDQFFIDWTDMMRRVLGRDIRTGTNGHDHYGFTRFRNHMTSGKVYALGGSTGHKPDSEYIECVGEELRQSFSGDTGFLTAPESMMTLSYDQKTPLANHRWPWKVLFAGYRGFDWEAGSCSSISLGGMSCFTPDYSEPMPFLKNIGEQVKVLQGGIGKLVNTSKPVRSPVAILWSPANHYISRLFIRKDDKLFVPEGKNPYIVPEPGFTGSWLYNISIDGGAMGDALVLMKNLRMRPTFVAPEDLLDSGLVKRGFKALILPWNKGMSAAEAEAIRAFVEQGGLVIADNDPASLTQFGRKLERGSLADLFPVTDKENVVTLGKGHAAYRPGIINGYLNRMLKGDYTGADTVAGWLRDYAGTTPVVELTDGAGKPRCDTLMPVYQNGPCRFLGLLRAASSEGKGEDQTAVTLDKKYHVWDVPGKQYLGFIDKFDIKLDMLPKFYALLPAKPAALTLTPAQSEAMPGQLLSFAAEFSITDGPAEAVAALAQVLHLTVTGPDGKELECYRDNLLFNGATVKIALPVSYSEKPGKYQVKVDQPLVGLSAKAEFSISKR